MASETEELNFQFSFIVINLNFNSHMLPVAYYRVMAPQKLLSESLKKIPEPGERN